MEFVVGTVLKNYCAAAIRAMQAQFEASQSITHGASLGAIREQAIRDFLKGHLPSGARVVSGQVFDVDDNRSTQQDVIITVDTVPRLPFASGIDLVFAEGVVATIEIKSQLSGPALKSSGSGLQSVRKLTPRIWGYTASGVSHNWPINRILSAVVSYGGSSLQNLKQVLSTMDDDSQPDLILDLSSGMLVKNSGYIIARSGSEPYVELYDPAEGFMLLLIVLTEITGTIVSRGIDWRAYGAPK